MGILCLESHLNKTAIVAEDLGVVPDEFRNAMREKALFSNKVFYFEKWSDTVFKKPEEYDDHALAMINNHDVPTLTSWWNETDLVLREQLSLLEPGVALEDVIDHRRREKENILEQLEARALMPEQWRNLDIPKATSRPIDWPLLSAIMTFSAKSRSKIFVIQLEDLLMMDAPVNVPGTHLEHKNWSRKLDANLEDIFASNSILETIERIRLSRVP
jgi:4-alpha-glucanotransferase